MPKVTSLARGAKTAVKVGTAMYGVAKTAAPVVRPMVKKAVDNARESATDDISAQQALQAASTFASNKVDGAKASVMGLRESFKARRSRKANAAKSVLRKAAADGASVVASVEDFEQKWNAADREKDANSLGSYALSGCYAILTCDNAVEDGDYSACREAFVDGCDCIGEGVHAQLMGEGDKDVYADYKYNQHMYVLMFPCVESEIASLKRMLENAFELV